MPLTMFVNFFVKQAHWPPWLRRWHRPKGGPRQNWELFHEPKDSVQEPDGLQWLCKWIFTVAKNLKIYLPQFLLTASFWLIPSFFWKSSLASRSNLDQNSNQDLVVENLNTQPEVFQEKTTGSNYKPYCLVYIYLHFIYHYLNKMCISRSCDCLGDSWSSRSLQQSALSHLHTSDYCHKYTFGRKNTK